MIWEDFYASGWSKLYTCKADQMIAKLLFWTTVQPTPKLNFCVGKMFIWCLYTHLYIICPTLRPRNIVLSNSSIFMKSIKDAVNAGKSVPKFIKKFSIKNVLWFIAWAQEDVYTKETLHKLWSGLIFENACNESYQIKRFWFTVCKKKFHRTCVAKDKVNNLNEENLAE